MRDKKKRDRYLFEEKSERQESPKVGKSGRRERKRNDALVKGLDSITWGAGKCGAVFGFVTSIKIFERIFLIYH